MYSASAGYRPAAIDIKLKFNIGINTGLYIVSGEPYAVKIARTVRWEQVEVFLRLYLATQLINHIHYTYMYSF